MDLIVTTCRALANRPRLRLLRAVYEHPGITVQALAERAGFTVDATSRNLKLLRNFQLVQTMPSGRYVRCAPAKPGSTSNVFLTDLQKLLAVVFGAGSLKRTLAQVCDASAPSKPTWDQVFNALVAHFTTFTHLRRLLILRWLAGAGLSSPEQLMAGLRMSADATRRHLDKLHRRGVAARVAGSPDGWTLLRDAGPPARRELLKITLRQLVAK